MCKFSTWPEGIVDSIYSSNISPGFNNVQAHVMNHFNNNIMITARQRDFIFLMGRWTIWLVLLLFIICYTTWYKNDKNFRFCFVIFLRISVFNLSIPQRYYNMSGKVTNDNRLRYFWDFEVLKRSEKWQEFVTIIPSKNIDNKRWENEIGVKYIFTYRYDEMFARN